MKKLKLEISAIGFKEIKAGLSSFCEALDDFEEDIQSGGWEMEQTLLHKGSSKTQYKWVVDCDDFK